MNIPNRFLPLTALALLLTLVACSSTPPNKLADEGDARTITVAQPVEATYRRVVEGMRACYSGKDIGADFFADNRSARVAMSVKSGLSITSMLVVDLSAQGTSTIVAIHYFKRVPAFADAVEMWISGNYSNCPFS